MTDEPHTPHPAHRQNLTPLLNPRAIAVKEVTRATETLSLPECYALLRGGTLAAYQAMRASEDAREGPHAFAEKRAPVWKGK
jgi:enoyl-CoA hydratase/carnithine racemase